MIHCWFFCYQPFCSHLLHMSTLCNPLWRFQGFKTGEFHTFGCIDVLIAKNPYFKGQKGPNLTFLKNFKMAYFKSLWYSFALVSLNCEKKLSNTQRFCNIFESYLHAIRFTCTKEPYIVWLDFYIQNIIYCYKNAYTLPSETLGHESF